MIHAPKRMEAARHSSAGYEGTGGEGGEESPGPQEVVHQTAGHSRGAAVAIQTGQIEDIVQEVVARLQAKGPQAPASARPKKALFKKKRKAPSSTSASDSEESEAYSSLSKRSRGRRKVVGGKRVKMPPQKKGKKKLREAWSPDPWQSETPTSSGDSAEEGELSGADEDECDDMGENRMFPIEFFPKLLGKAVQTLNLSPPEKEPSVENKQSKKASKFLPAKTRNKNLTIPLPESFKEIIENEWKEPSRPRRAPRTISKLYSMQEDAMTMLSVPTVDQPVAALASSAIIPSEREGGPKDPCDRRVEAALKRGFETSSLALRATTANSVIARAMMAWIEELENSREKMSRTMRNSLRKISMAAAFTADSSLDTMQFIAKSLASNVAARRSVWLRRWEVDQGSQSRLAAFPFAGDKLFGQTLDPLLVENKDKKKVLPTIKKDPPKGRATFFPQRNRQSFRRREGARKTKWNKGRFFPKGRPSGGGDFTSTASSSKQKGPRPS